LLIADGSIHHALGLADVALNAVGKFMVTFPLMLRNFKDIVVAVMGKELLKAYTVFIFW
jgi:hypothetical protein